jgi:hypothetical protein
MMIVLAGLIGFLFWRQRRIFNEIQVFYKDSNLTYREKSPVEHPFIYTDINPICSQGFIKPEMPYTFILGSRSTGAGQSRILHTYIGVYLPNHPRLTDEWLQQWKEKVAERGDNWAQHSGVEKMEGKWSLMGPPENLPIVATRINDGVLIAWSGLHIRKVFDARLKELKETLP